MAKLFYVIAITVAFIALLLLNAEVRRLIKVGGNFTSKNVCSGVFVSTMSDASMLQFELKGLAATLFHFEVNYDEKTVVAYVGSQSFSRFVGFHISKVYFIEGRGCLFYKGKAIEASPSSSDTSVQYDNEIQSFLEYQVSPAAFKQNQTRGTVVMHRGKIVAEAYQSEKLNLTSSSRLLGWSMTKSVQSMIIGAAIQLGMLTLDTPVKLSELEPSYLKSLIHRNKGNPITFRDLITMSDILPCEEDYEFTEYVPDMLFNSDDHGSHASSCTYSVTSSSSSSSGGESAKIIKNGFTRNVNTRGSDSLHSTVNSKYKRINSSITSSNFDFYYSSSLSNLLAKEFRNLFASEEEYLHFPMKHLFGPIGASSFIIETDESGIFVASSFGYATPRDWALLGDLLRRSGEWNGKQIISKEYVEFMFNARSFSGGHYGGSIWLNPARVDVSEYNYLKHDNKDKIRLAWMSRAVPHDTAMMSGFNGQYVMIIPSLNCVIVRLGFSPGVWDSSILEDQESGSAAIPFDNFAFFGALSKHCMRLNDKI